MKYRWWLVIAAVLFTGGLVLGLITPASVSGLPSEEVDALKKLAQFLEPLPRPAFLAFLFLKNVSAVLISFVLSPFLCILPVLALTVNGWLLGYVAVMLAGQKSVGYVLAGILPHGIFEIPALIIGEAVALSFGTTVMIALFRKDGQRQIAPAFKANAKYLLISIGLLVIAAVIETYVTPRLLGRI